jgi:hypothetical protein
VPEKNSSATGISSQVQGKQTSDLSNSSSNASSNNQNNMESVLYFDSTNLGNNVDSKTMNQMLHNTISFYSTKGDTQACIKKYLQQENTYKNAPDSAVYDNGKILVAYYTDKAKTKTSFVFHIYYYGDAVLSGQAFNTNSKEYSVICTTINSSDFQKIGTLKYTLDNKLRTNQESLYDTNGKQMASIGYQYSNSCPFPFITNYNDVGSDKSVAKNILNLNQRFWLFMGKAEFNQTGKWTGYSGDIYDSTMDNHFACSYDANGNLQNIIGNKGQQNDAKNEVTLSYQNNGLLSTVCYSRPESTYGTFDFSGDIYYDANGRMIYRTYYVTHGPQYVFYLYNGEDKKPWICVNLDSEIWGTNADGVDYGNPVNAYLFQ